MPVACSRRWPAPLLSALTYRQPIAGLRRLWHVSRLLTVAPANATPSHANHTPDAMFRQPLLRCSTAGPALHQNDIDPDVFQLLTDAQLAWFARVSLEYRKPVSALLSEMRPMAEQEGDADTVQLVGLLPSCGLYGCLDSAGRTHT